MTNPGDVDAARRLTSQALELLRTSPSLPQLDPRTRDQLTDDLARIQSVLGNPDPYDFALASDPRQLRRGGAGGGPVISEPPQVPAEDGGRRAPQGTAALPERAGALLDEIDFPRFVAQLVAGTFDAVVDATIRQLEAFADLISAVAKTVDQFTVENTTPNQARDWLAERYPGDLELRLPEGREGEPELHVRGADDFAAERSPAWLADFGLADQDLTDELVEERLVPLARQRIGESRQQLLATMVLLGMNRITVRDGRISARLMFRAAATDRTQVDFAVGQDPGGETWATRGSATYSTHQTMVSTIGLNTQSDVGLKADLYGSVELNFVSETLPLDRFADTVQLALLQRHARWAPPTQGASGAAAPAQPAVTGPPPAAAPLPQPTPPQPTPSQPAPRAVPPATGNGP